MKAQKLKRFEMPKNFSGIEEVAASMERSFLAEGGTVGCYEIEDTDPSAENNEMSDVISGGEVKVNGIEDVENSSQDEKNVINGGSISDRDILEVSHKMKMRPYIVGIAFSLWIIWTFVGLVMFQRTGNAILLISSPATVGGIALYRVLFRIVKYYF